HGSVELRTNGSFTYTPDPGYSGADGFTYRAYDGVGYSDPATVSINVLPVNGGLVANDDSFSIPSGLTLQPEAPGVLTNDTAPSGVAFHAVLADAPAHSSVFSLNEDGSFEYKSADGYVGPDSFTYRIADGQDTSYTGTVSITVEDDPDIIPTAFYSDGTD